MAENQVEKKAEGREEPAATAEQPLTLEQQLAAEKAQAAEYLDNWRRVSAEFVNYKKREEKDRAEFLKFANAALVARLLEVLDGFDSAFNAIPEKFRKEPWVEGVRLVEQKLKTVLDGEGLKPIEARGKAFDPAFHEAMFVEETDEQPEGTVLSEFRKGYLLGERVLRPTLVKVAKSKVGSKQGDR
jgi:molecular chaperone GrpE